MLAQDILPYVKAAPFRPFDIRHPEMIRLTRTTVRVFEVTGDDGLADRLEMLLGVELIETVSYLDPPVATRPSGAAGG